MSGHKPLRKRWPCFLPMGSIKRKRPVNSPFFSLNGVQTPKRNHACTRRACLKLQTRAPAFSVRRVSPTGEPPPKNLPFITSAISTKPIGEPFFYVYQQWSPVLRPSQTTSPAAAQTRRIAKNFKLSRVDE